MKVKVAETCSVEKNLATSVIPGWIEFMRACFWTFWGVTPH